MLIFLSFMQCKCILRMKIIVILLVFGLFLCDCYDYGIMQSIITMTICIFYQYQYYLNFDVVYVVKLLMC